MASPMLSIKYRYSLLLRSLICSAQPYSHGTLGAWPRPRNPRNRAAAASVSQTTNYRQYSPFLDSHSRDLCSTRPCSLL